MDEKDPLSKLIQQMPEEWFAQKTKVLKIVHPNKSDHPVYVDSVFDIESIIDSMLMGDDVWADYLPGTPIITITVVEIRNRELLALEPFDGF